MFHRLCNPSKLNSFFLFGARGTGKTTLIKSLPFLKEATFIDLLIPEEEARFSSKPSLLLELASSLRKASWIALDEVQKVPKLLDLVHKIIEEQGVRFALTGSSSRKLRRGSANLLAGRAFWYRLHPLTEAELGNRFELNELLTFGSLPKIFEYNDPADRIKYLSTYVHTYLKEEIQVEQLVRNLNPFRLFLQVAAQMNGEIINYSNIAKDTGVDIKTIQTYFQILNETHLGTFLEPFGRSVRKVQRQSPKFYFFDSGIQRALQGTVNIPLSPATTDFGNLFEAWYINECHRLNDYFELDFRFSYLRTKDDVEVDLILQRPGKPEALVEIKSTEKTDERHFRSLTRFANDFPKAELFCVSRDSIPRRVGRIQVLPFRESFRALGLKR